MAGGKLGSRRQSQAGACLPLRSQPRRSGREAEGGWLEANSGRTLPTKGSNPFFSAGTTCGCSSEDRAPRCGRGGSQVRVLVAALNQNHLSGGVYAEVAQSAERLLPTQEVRGFEARLPLKVMCQRFANLLLQKPHPGKRQTRCGALPCCFPTPTIHSWRCHPGARDSLYLPLARE